MVMLSRRCPALILWKELQMAISTALVINFIWVVCYFVFKYIFEYTNSEAISNNSWPPTPQTSLPSKKNLSG